MGENSAEYVPDWPAPLSRIRVASINDEPVQRGILYPRERIGSGRTGHPRRLREFYRNSNAGILDLKLDAGHNDTLTLAANGTYSYWDAATGGNQISNGTSATSVNVSALTTAGADIYVFDSTHTTLLADLHYHV